MKRLPFSTLVTFSCMWIIYGCSSNYALLQSTVNIKKHNLKTNEQGAGLAQPLPEHSLLINPEFDISIATAMEGGMGVALAAAMHEGKSKKIAKELNDISPLNIEQKLEIQLKKEFDQEDDKNILKLLKRKKQRIILSPYMYLSGYPEAELKTKIVVKLLDARAQTLHYQSYEHTSPKHPLFGKSSWIEEDGALLHQEINNAFPHILANIWNDFVEGW